MSPVPVCPQAAAKHWPSCLEKMNRWSTGHTSTTNVCVFCILCFFYLDKSCLGMWAGGLLVKPQQRGFNIKNYLNFAINLNDKRISYTNEFNLPSPEIQTFCTAATQATKWPTLSSFKSNHYYQPFIIHWTLSALSINVSQIKTSFTMVDQF